jgi:UDP-N-acetyl-D-mannosaminuronic acid dehydrogenase
LDLNEKIITKHAKVCVIGLGQVGLPTALTFSHVGFSVIGIDINQDLINKLNSKITPFVEHGLDELLSTSIDSGRFTATNELSSSIPQSDIIVVCVATPINDQIQPNLSFLENACNSLSNFSLDNKLIIIESSIPPGTFEELVLPILKKSTGSNFHMAYVPERLSPGQGLDEIQNTPRLIGTNDEISKNMTEKFYKNMVKSQIVHTSIKIGQISKLVENTYRDVNIAFANEISRICELYGIDVQDLIKVSNSHPRVDILQPGPGVGGPCLPKDPYLLLNPKGQAPIKSELISNSRNINDNVPVRISSMTALSLKKQNKIINDSSVLILGTAYKNNVSDSRFSPAKNLIYELQKIGLTVFAIDPFTNERFGAKNINSIWDIIKKIDVIIVITGHDDFKTISLSKIKEHMKSGLTIIDTRRIFDKIECESLGIDYFSTGYTNFSNMDGTKT